MDLDPDPDWSPASNAGSGSGSNECGSETLFFLSRKLLDVTVEAAALLASCCCRNFRSLLRILAAADPLLLSQAEEEVYQWPVLTGELFLPLAECSSS